jgi:hypothetical protein
VQAGSEVDGVSHPGDQVGGPTARSTGRCEGVLAHTGVRRPGGQPGNRNRWVHGKRSDAATRRRKTGAAGRKLAAWILVQLDALPGYRCRPRPVRANQLAYIEAEALELLIRLKTPGVSWMKQQILQHDIYATGLFKDEKIYPLG